jgi:hypothetical protein
MTTEATPTNVENQLGLLVMDIVRFFYHGKMVVGLVTKITPSSIYVRDLITRETYASVQTTMRNITLVGTLKYDFDDEE